MTDLDLKSRLQHPSKTKLMESNESLSPPLYTSVKYTVPKMADLRNLFSDENMESGFFYARVSSPTVKQLEDNLALIQGCESGIAFASGVAAISHALIALLKTGDDVLLFLESYKPTRMIVREILAKFGVGHYLLSIHDHEGIRRVARIKKPKLMIFESPTNPMLAIADLTFLKQISEEFNITSIMDNTFAGIHNHGSYEFDLYIHSLTKYVCGHGDTMGGVVLGKRQLLKDIKFTAIELGAVMDPRSAYLHLRGLKTYAVRYERACQNACLLAQRLEQHPGVAKIFYPGLHSHPQHELAKKQQHDFGAVIAFQLKQSASLEVFIDRLNLFTLAGSLGSTESLVAPAQQFYGGDISTEQSEQAFLNGQSMRLSIGLEDAEDLWSDLLQAFG